MRLDLQLTQLRSKKVSMRSCESQREILRELARDLVGESVRSVESERKMTCR